MIDLFDGQVLNNAKKEEKIFREIMSYFKDENDNFKDYNPDDSETKRNLRRKIYELFKIKVEEMGYAPMLFDKEVGDTKIDIRQEEIPPDIEKNEKVIGIAFYNNDEVNSEGGGHYNYNLIDDGKAKYGINIVSINEHKLEDYKHMINVGIAMELITMYHELIHVKQTLMARTGVSSKENLIYSREQAILRYSPDEENYETNSLYEEFYMKNHDKFKIEADANSQSRVYLLENFMHRFLNTHNIEFIRKQYFSHQGRLIQPEFDDEVSDILDVIIDEGLLKLYPVLQKEYNDDKTRKSSMQLVTALKSEQQEISNLEGLNQEEKNALLKNSMEMYFELIYKAISKENLSREDAQKLNEVYGENDLFVNIKKYFQQQKERIRSSGIYLDKNQQQMAIDYYQRKIDFIDNNFLQRDSVTSATDKWGIPSKTSKSDINDTDKWSIPSTDVDRKKLPSDNSSLDGNETGSSNSSSGLQQEMGTTYSEVEDETEERMTQTEVEDENEKLEIKKVKEAIKKAKIEQMESDEIIYELKERKEMESLKNNKWGLTREQQDRLHYLRVKYEPETIQKRNHTKNSQGQLR